MNHRHFFYRTWLGTLAVFFLTNLTTLVRAEAQRVAVVVGAQAPDLERYTGQQLCHYLNRLYNIHVQPTTERDSAAAIHLLVGSPLTNPCITQAVKSWPQVSDQGIVLKRSQFDGKPALIIGGGSSRATMWAMYEMAQRWGVRYLLHGDVFPEPRAVFRLPDEDIILEPNLRVRQWRVINDFPCGPESWGMADYRPVLDQLAKLKFNRVLLVIYPWQPFLHIEVAGVARRSAHLWFDMHYPISDDMPGRHLFDDRPEFWNPDLPFAAPYEEFAAAGEKLVHQLMEYAHQRGMECALTVPLPRFPLEFRELIQGSEVFNSFRRQTIVPGSETSLDDPGLTQVATAMLKAAIDTYPEVDFFAIGMPEKRKWVGQYEAAWNVLDAKYNLSAVTTLENLLQAAQGRKEYPGGSARAVQEVKGDLTALYFYDRLMDQFHPTRRAPNSSPQGKSHTKPIKLIYDAVAEELFPILDRILPVGSETLNFIDYTPTRILQRRETLAALGDSNIPATLIYTLHDDNVGILPQLATGSLHKLTQALRQHHWVGFSTRYWLVSDHDPCVAYLAQAAWDATATPESTYRDQVRAACGTRAVMDMLEMFRELENTTVILEHHGLGLTFPVPGMITKHWTSQAMPEKLREVQAGYQRGLEAARRAGDQSNEAGKIYVDYWVGRLEFGVGYLDLIKTVRAAASAEASQHYDEALRQAELALVKSRHALETYARVARDRSDYGAIATMGEYVYRPLQKKVHQLRESVDHGQENAPPSRR